MIKTKKSCISEDFTNKILYFRDIVPIWEGGGDGGCWGLGPMFYCPYPYFH